MKVESMLKIDRFAQLAPGDLFIFIHKNESCVALKVVDPTNDGDKFILPLGPTFPAATYRPTLMGPKDMTVVSFGKDYTLKLPTQATGWLANEPGPNQHCFVVNERGVYVRANFAPSSEPIRWCYVDIGSGSILSNDRSYIEPVSPSAYAIDWTLLTNETEPRDIVSAPH
jgi:hypothetical protein